MGLLDIFNFGAIKKENERLNKALNDLKGMDYLEILVQTDKLREDLLKLESESISLKKNIDLKKSQCLVFDEQIFLESFALYTPKFNFTSSQRYKDELIVIRNKQKELIKANKAATGNSNWTVNNSKTEGKKMVNDMIKLSLRSFNNECDSCVDAVKFNNVESMEKRIKSSYEAINKLGRIMNVTISNEYYQLKFKELYLAHEYQIKKQEEKENLKVLREQQREEARLAKEIEEARKNIDKEQKHYSNALSKYQSQLADCENDLERANLMGKIEEINNKLNDINEKLAEVDYREANQKAGYVYVISNIGAFGENVYKIGMTRRLEPEERVDELGDASVPFSFDIHALIFSDDAPKLENALHRAFDDKKVNMINKRKEFFNVTLDEIERVIQQNHDKTIDFIKHHDAEEYRESLLIKEKSN